jgi:hypothetical protein
LYLNEFEEIFTLVNLNMDENILILNSNLIFTNLKSEIKTIFKNSPLKIYNLMTDRFKLLKEHRITKIGVYCLFNTINGNFYIGSSTNLNGRMKNYLNKSFLISKKNANQPIIKALSKYGTDKFLVIIIEYTKKEFIFEKETF